MSDKKQERRRKQWSETADLADLRIHDGYVSYSDEEQFELFQIIALYSEQSIDSIGTKDFLRLWKRLQMAKQQQDCHVEDVVAPELWMAIGVALARSVEGTESKLSAAKKRAICEAIQGYIDAGQNFEPVKESLAARYGVSKRTIDNIWKDRERHLQ